MLDKEQIQNSHPSRQILETSLSRSCSIIAILLSVQNMLSYLFPVNACFALSKAPSAFSVAAIADFLVEELSTELPPEFAPCKYFGDWECWHTPHQSAADPRTEDPGDIYHSSSGNLICMLLVNVPQASFSNMGPNSFWVRCCAGGDTLA